MTEDLQATIFKYGQEGAINELKQILQTTDTKLLCEIVKKLIPLKKFLLFFDYLILGLKDDQEWANIKCTKLLLIILKQLHLSSRDNCETIVMKICMCVQNCPLKSEHLAALVAYLLELIQKGDKERMFIWKVILPCLMTEMQKFTLVVYNDEELSQENFNMQIITNLLNMEWSSEIVISIAEMLKEMPLLKTSTLKLIVKLANSLEQIDTQEIPLLVYHILALWKPEHTQTFFLRLQHFFNKHIYENNPLLNSIDSESMNSINATANLDLIQAESTVLYHIVTKSTGQNLKVYINSLNDYVKIPESILQPFNLTLLLSLSSIDIYRDAIFDVIKAAILRYCAEEEKQKRSCWFRENVPDHVKLTDVIKKVINISSFEQNLVVEGLVHLAFVLLNSKDGSSGNNDKVSNLGILIVMTLIKRKREVAPLVLDHLKDSLVYRQNMNKIIECFAMVASKYGFTILENTPTLIEALYNIISINSIDANEFIEALMPIIKVASVIREDLILLLKKTLHSNILESRVNAVNGYLKMLKYLKLSNLTSLSQTSQQHSSCSFSLSTQISMARSGFAMSNVLSNESICLEVLSTLKRCFILQVEVKIRLYEGLYDAVNANKDLALPVLSFLWDHLRNYLETDNEVLPPLLFAKISKLRDADAHLVEPLGKLLHAIALILAKLKNMEQGSGNLHPEQTIVDHYVLNFLEISQKMGRSELEHFALNDGTDLSDILPESQEKCLILQEIVSCYEALFTYNLLTWSMTSENYGQSTKALFKAYQRVVDFAKHYQRGKKDKKNVSRTQNSTTANNTTGKLGLSARKIKLPPTILHITTLERFITILYNANVEWAIAEEANIVKSNVALHLYALESLQTFINNLKSLKYLPRDQKGVYYKHLKTIASILYIRCAKLFRDLLNFDTTVAILSLDVLSSILQVFNVHYKRKLETVDLCSTMLGCDEDNLNYEEVLQTFQELFNTIDDDSGNPETAKLVAVLINTITLLVEQISAKNSQLSAKIIDWMKQCCVEKALCVKNSVSNYVSLLFQSLSKHKVKGNVLLETFAKAVGGIDGWITENENETEKITLAIVNSSTSSTIVINLCTEVKSMLDDLDWIIVRIRLEHNYIHNLGMNHDGRKDELKSKEWNVCRKFGAIISLMTIINNIATSLGPVTENQMKNNVHLFNSLSNLAKYFLNVSTQVNVAFQSAGFKDVVRQVVKKLSPVIDKQILYIEQNQINEPKKKKSGSNAEANNLKSKLIREMRWIPKLVFETEQFKKIVIQITKKTKVDVYKYLGLGTARDFRILDIKAAIGSNRVSESMADDVSMDISGEETASAGTDDHSFGATDTDIIMDEEHSDKQNKKSGGGSKAAKRPRRK